MKLVLIHERFRKEGGGLERYLYQFAKSLRDDGHQTYVVTADQEPSKIEGIQFVSIAKVSKNKTTRLKQFAQESVKALKEIKPDKSIGFGRTYYQDIHRAGAGCHKEYQKNLSWLKKQTPKNKLELELERKLYQGDQTQHYVVNSEKVKKEIEHHYQTDPQKIHIIRTGIDHQIFKPLDQEYIKSETPVFLFVSLDHKRKGLEQLLNSFTDQKAQLSIMGAPLSKKFQTLINKHPNKDRINFIPQGDPISHYQSADYYVLPTKYDACANTTLQALACGLPVISSSEDGASEFVTEGENGWISNSTSYPNNLRSLIEKAIATPQEKYKNMRKNASDSVSHLTWANHLRDWYSLLNCE